MCVYHRTHQICLLSLIGCVAFIKDGILTYANAVTYFGLWWLLIYADMVNIAVLTNNLSIDLFTCLHCGHINTSLSVVWYCYTLRECLSEYLPIRCSQSTKLFHNLFLIVQFHFSHTLLLNILSVEYILILLLPFPSTSLKCLSYNSLLLPTHNLFGRLGVSLRIFLKAAATARIQPYLLKI